MTTEPVNQNKKFPLVVIGHYAWLGVSGALVLAALFVIWSFVTREYEPRPAPADPITRDDFDRSLDYLGKRKDVQ